MATQLVNYLSNNERGVAAIRRLSSELLKEATERGDLDHPTVTWVVTRMLQHADYAVAFDEAGKR